MEIEFRKAKLQDVPTIVSMWKQFMNDHDKIIIPRDSRIRHQVKRTKDSHEKFERFVAKNIRSRNSIVLIASLGGKITGFAQGIIKNIPSIFVIDKIGLISDLYVKKEFRGKGLGSKMIAELEKAFKQKKLKYSSLGVYHTNPRAQKLYLKQGYHAFKIEMRKRL